ncbi:MAG: T9SS type A sorting domain-containing protein, partial [Flavobacteriales bacterium]
TIGVDYNNFLAGGELTITDGAWFVVPTDVQAVAEAGNRVLLMQLTTDGVATGVLNLQGWDGEGNSWRAHDLTFTSTNAQVFGCTDQAAANFNPAATYNDGTCAGANNGPSNGLTNFDGTTAWNIFPNPVFESTFSVSFDRELNLGGENMVLEVSDMTGKMVMSQEIAQENVVGGNRIVVKHSLAAGNYTVAVKHAKFSDAQTIVVTR